MPAPVPTDMLNDSLKEIVFLRHNQPLIRKLAKRTHFNQREVEALTLIHRKIKQQAGPVARLNFRDILHSGLDYTENIRHLLVDRVFSAIDKQNALQVTYHHTLNNKLTFEGDFRKLMMCRLQLHADQWNEGFSVILRGTIDERIQFGYKVYDLMRTNKIRKEQIFPMMRGCLIRQQPDEDPDEGVKVGNTYN